jgi:hypothetical protein
MPAPAYKGTTGSAVALSAATAKSVIGVKAHANSLFLLKQVRYGFDGVTSSAVPTLIELCYATFATNAPGTNSTSVTALQNSGRVTAAGFTMGKNWTTEPTVLSVLEDTMLTPNSGVLWYDFPLGDEYDCALGEGFVLRMTAPAAVNARAVMGGTRG